MDKDIKNYLGKAIIASIIVFSLSAVGYVYFYSKSIQPSSFRSFSVSGEGKANAIPDIAKFNFSVITEGGKDISGLQKINTDKANAIIDFLKTEGIKSEDIKTESYNLEPRYQYYTCRDSGPCPPPEIVGYTVTQSVSVKIRDFSKIGQALSGVVENGANSVSQLSFAVDDPTEVETEARVEAISKAKEKAKAVALAGGFRLGRLLSIDESYSPQPIYRTMAYEALGKGGGDAAAPSIEPGSQEVTVNVVLKYEIK